MKQIIEVKNIKERLRYIEISVKCCNLHLIMVTECKGRKNGAEAIFEEIVVIEPVNIFEKFL